MTLLFPDAATVHFAMASGIVPHDVLASPLRVAFRQESQIVIQPSPFPDETSRRDIIQLGVEILKGDLENDATPLGNWFQIFPLVRDLHPQTLGLPASVLFEISDDDELQVLVNELLRQAHDRSALSRVSVDGRKRLFLKVMEPPVYTLLAATDNERVVVYQEAAPRVWIQMGYRHPYSARIEFPEDQMMLLRSERVWEPVPVGPFRDISDLVDVQTPPTESRDAAPSPEPWLVPLIASPSASTESPSMWVMRSNAIHQMDELVERADERMMNQLSFALATSHDDPVVVVRLRPTKWPSPRLSLEAEEFRPWLRLPNLFVPLGWRIDPPLRRAMIQQILASNPATVTWLSLNVESQFEAKSLPDDSFQPLSAWVDRVLERNRVALKEWTESTEFDFGGIVLQEPISAASAENKPKTTRTGAKSTAASNTQLAGPKDTRPMRRPQPISESQRIDQRIDNSEARERLTQLEAEFLAVDGPLDDPSRQSRWQPMAELNAALLQPAEAALAWTHAIWNQPLPDAAMLKRWVQTEYPNGTIEQFELELDRVLSATPATTGDVRFLAAAMIESCQNRESTPILTRLEKVQAYLHVNERLLPVRAVWLAWSAWSALAGGDVLTLVRARDRLLTRLLERGLDADCDLPAFMRFAGRADADRLRSVREWIDEVRDRIRQWYGDQTKVDVSRDPTAAYIDLFFAFGLARLGEAGAARALVKQSETILEEVGDDTRDAHLVLSQALSWRVEQVLAGRAHSGPLPKELLDYLAQMHVEAAPLPRTNEYNKRRTCPYAVERFREQSRIMEPLEKFDPYRHTRREGHELVREAAKLPDVRDPSSLTIRIRQLLRPTEGVPELRVRVLAECVPMAGRLGAEAAGTLLDAAAHTLGIVNTTTDGPSLETRLRLMERSLFFAAHFDRSDLVPVFVEQLARLFETDAATVALEGSGYALGQTLRSLRKLGLRDDSIRILERLEHALLQGQSIESLHEQQLRNWPALLQTLLQVAAGWVYFDNAVRAAPVIDAANRLLMQTGRSESGEVARPHYVQVMCNLIAVFGFLPPAEARAKIAALFEGGKTQRLPNTFTTSSFYSRFHLNVAESVVLTLSGEDFTLGPAARRWLDEDEFLIRRRVHRDVRAALDCG